MTGGGGHGDEEFEAVFRALYPSALRVALKVLREPPDAEDAVSEAFARALLSWGRISRLDYRDAWIMRVTANVAVDAARKQDRVSRLVSDVVVGDDDVAGRLDLVAALASLPRRQREVVALRYLADVAAPDVAACLGISPSSVKEHTSRGMAALRGRLGPTWKEPDVATD
jgi:RNA polymerase sigma-70 factor (ECF subfamily)